MTTILLARLICVVVAVVALYLLWRWALGLNEDEA